MFSMKRKTTSVNLLQETLWSRQSFERRAIETTIEIFFAGASGRANGLHTNGS